MKHLIDPLDLSVEELDSYLDLATAYLQIRKNMLMFVTEKS